MKPPIRSEMLMKISVYIKNNFVDILAKNFLDDLNHDEDEQN